MTRLRNFVDLAYRTRQSEIERDDRVLVAATESVVQPQATRLVKGKAKLGRLSCVEYSLQIPAEPHDDTVEIHVNGLAAAKPPYRGVRKASASIGQMSVSLRPARGTAVQDLLAPRTLFHTEGLASESVLAVMDDIDRRFGLSRVKLRSHSMGGRTGVAVAEAAPERVDHITLVNAAGLEEHSLLVMMSRLTKFMKNDILPHRSLLYQEFHDPQVAVDIMRYILQNPLRTAAEAISISEADIRDRVRRLIGLQGIAVSIIDAEYDSLVSNKGVEASLGGEVMHYAMLSNPEIGHLGPQTHPTEMVDEYRRADNVVKLYRTQRAELDIAT